ncbi:plasmid mobilization protein [Daejeonia sp. YH14]|uniref:plasmid mobilization protein n=1 Tax=Daejeonia sp. YH14 TaxID=3439042 RepID=UPI003F498F25
MKKTQTLKFRITPLEDKIIRMKAENSGLSLSEFLRRTALDLEIKNKLTEDEIICYKNLSKYSDNFRRISNLFKQGNVTGMKCETMETSRLIREHLEKLKK